MTSPNARRQTMLLLALAALLGAAPWGVARAQLVEDKPEAIQDVGVDDKRGAQIPLELKFRDEHGDVIRLEDLFDGERPVLLSLNYSNCPMLCGVQLNGLTNTLKKMEWTTGEEFRVVSVSIDPTEQPSRAKKTEQKYLNQYGRPGVGAGWSFLTSNQDNITALADAVGFRYKFLPEKQEFAHTAAVMVCTPEGVVSRYLYGVMYDPQTVRLSLVEAAEGQVGSALDQVLLFCFHYDETEGRYGPAARRLMMLGGLVTVFAVAACLIPYWLLHNDKKVRQRAAAGAEPKTSAPSPSESSGPSEPDSSESQSE